MPEGPTDKLLKVQHDRSRSAASRQVAETGQMLPVTNAVLKVFLVRARWADGLLPTE